MPWVAVRVLLAEKFGVLPREIDTIEFTEMVDILAVLDGEGKAMSVNS
jgi:hypothetical protein